MLAAMLPLLIVASGQTLVLITAGIDLSVTSIIALTSVTGAMVMSAENGLLAGHALATPAGIVVMLVIGAVIGLLNGTCVTAFRMPPFIVTLTSMMFFSGFAVWLTKSKSIYDLPDSFLWIGKSTGAMLVITGLVVFSLSFLLLRTVPGRWIYSVGQNAVAARISGVPVKRVVLHVYMLSGLLAGLAAILITGRLETGSPVHWQNSLLDIIGATVIGGTSLYGGKGNIRWTVFGVLFLTLINNSLNLLNLSHFTIMLVKGGVILAAAVLDTLRNPSVSEAVRRRFLKVKDTQRENACPDSNPKRKANHNVFSCSDIVKSYFGIQVLKGVSFDLRPGSILGLVGENGAGKSTLMNIAGGNVAPDAGEMKVFGRTYQPQSPKDAEDLGIAFIHQELNLFTNLTIGENLHLTSFPRKMGLIDRRTIRKRSGGFLKLVGLDLSPDICIENLSAGERQLVEIAKALAINARIIILDEPTTSLTEKETAHLFSLMRSLRDQGVSMIYISHALHDVLDLCDRIVVLRDGEVVGNTEISECELDQLISKMVGRELKQLYPKRKTRPGKNTLLKVHGVTQPGCVRSISFVLREGEVLGLSGLMGSGRTELARFLFGLDSFRQGEIRLKDDCIHFPSPKRSIAAGFAFVTEDRRSQGLLMDASISDNMTLVALGKFADRPFYKLDASRLSKAVGEMRKGVKLTATAQNSQPVKTLSGGNQQKVVLAKWLMNQPRVFILDEPTRGIDVGARSEIYNLITELADQGAGILIVSSEIEELVGICDRILVMRKGEIQDEINCDEFDRERILRSALWQGNISRDTFQSSKGDGV